ncbi:MAG: PqqD family protein [Gammaproteobacteria bacterium]|nr:PqqD family protein [Gammaproteobacteria bacterium]
MLNHEQHFIQNKDLLSVEIDDELVMISEDQAHFISLNGTGKVIFDCLASSKSIDKIIDVVMSKFEVDKVRSTKDVETFLMHLIEHRVVLEVT